MANRRSTFEELYAKKLVLQSSANQNSFSGGASFSQGDYEIDDSGVLSVDGTGKFDLKSQMVIFGTGSMRIQTKTLEDITEASLPFDDTIAALSESVFECNLTSNSVDLPLTITDPASLTNAQTIKFYVVAHSGDGTKELTVTPDGTSCALANGTSDIVITPASGVSLSRTIFVHKPAAGGTIRVW